MPEMNIGQQLDGIVGGAGPFGLARTNPIPGDPDTYLRKLRCSRGHLVIGKRRGNVGSGPDGHYVDEYVVQCIGSEMRTSLYFDAYHQGTSTIAPDGFTLVAYMALPTKLPQLRLRLKPWPHVVLLFGWLSIPVGYVFAFVSLGYPALGALIGVGLWASCAAAFREIDRRSARQHEQFVADIIDAAPAKVQARVEELIRLAEMTREGV